MREEQSAWPMFKEILRANWPMFLVMVVMNVLVWGVIIWAVAYALRWAFL